MDGRFISGQTLDQSGDRIPNFEDEKLKFWCHSDVFQDVDLMI